MAFTKLSLTTKIRKINIRYYIKFKIVTRVISLSSGTLDFIKDLGPVIK